MRCLLLTTVSRQVLHTQKVDQQVQTSCHGLHVDTGRFANVANWQGNGITVQGDWICHAHLFDSIGHEHQH